MSFRYKTLDLTVNKKKLITCLNIVLVPEPLFPTRRIFCKVLCSRWSKMLLLLALWSWSPEALEIDFDGTGSDNTAQSNLVPA